MNDFSQFLHHFNLKDGDIIKSKLILTTFKDGSVSSRLESDFAPYTVNSKKCILKERSNVPRDLDLKEGCFFFLDNNSFYYMGIINHEFSIAFFKEVQTF